MGLMRHMGLMGCSRRAHGRRVTANCEPRTVNCEPLIWGKDLEPEALNQIRQACRLPVTLAGALMPDAHVGYGLPIGGVLATDNTVIPYGVGVDIACRMKMSVLDWNPTLIAGMRDRLANVLESETKFGVGAAFRQPRSHAVM
jgi:tRNA-splicing ligase RtcB